MNRLKLLFCILLFSTAVSAQNEPVYDSCGFLLIPIDTIDLDWPEPKSYTFLTIELIKEYESWCYDNPIKVPCTVYMGTDGDEFVKYHIGGLDTCYRSREMTFESFIHWLRDYHD